MNPRILAAVLTVCMAGLIVACGGDSSKDSTPTAAANTASARTTVPSVSPTTAPASTAATGDFCSRIPTDATASVAGASANAVTGDLATVVAGRLPSSVTTPLATCRYRSDAGLLTVSSIPVTGYEAIIAANPGVTQQAVSGVGDVATLSTINASAPFAIDGRPYTGQVVLLAKTADKAMAINVLTTGDVSSVDVERLKGLARTLLQ